MLKKPRRRHGRFFVVEGPDGCGKTTQARRLANYLKRKGRGVHLFREPGGTRVGKKIRRILLDPGNDEITVVVELLLYMASRAQLAHERILPALRVGDDVVCDRFLLSSIIYQGYAGGLDRRHLQVIADVAIGKLRPDATFVLSLPFKVAMERRGKKTDRIESRGRPFHRKVLQGYLEYAKGNPQGVFVINSTGTINAVQHEIRDIVEKTFP